MAATSFLVVIYGPALAGKSTLARELAATMPGPAAVVSLDQLAEAIAVPHLDQDAELAMIHTQLRLLVVNYLKNGYHVVVEGPFVHERDGVLHNAEAEIDQLVALMRNLVARALIVRLEASEALLRARAQASERESELDTALRVAAAYKQRYGDRFLAFDGEAAPAPIITAINDYLQAETSPSRPRPPTVQ